MKYKYIKRYQSKFKPRYLCYLSIALAKYRQQILFRGTNTNDLSVIPENIDISGLYYDFNYSLPFKKQLELKNNDE